MLQVYSSNFILKFFHHGVFGRFHLSPGSVSVALLTWALAESLHAMPRDCVADDDDTGDCAGCAGVQVLISRVGLVAMQVPIPRLAPPRLHHATRGSLSALYTLCLDLHCLPLSPSILLPFLDNTMGLGLPRENQIHS